MLVNLREILAIAEEKQIAIGSFNTPNMTALQAVIAAAEEANEPVILMHAQVHEEMGLCKMDEIAPVMLQFAKVAKVPVCVHLDHGTDLDYVKRGLELGFTSVMYDGSTLSEEENTANTCKAVAWAKETNASVEAEIGSMGAREGGGGSNDASIYTDPDAAARFVENTGVDALACAFGTAHGFYKDAPKLDFERLSAIRERIAVPIVMHGGSGVIEADYYEVIRRGVRKINYYTYMAKAGGEAISQKTYTQFHDALLDAKKAMQENVKQAISVFAAY
ncbi:MAG: class II fructose-bisphosphate aldolase [Clostridia bacterium]|nr:class II fructose-bisphosphate aldolase [Clostridia bacterium]